MPATGYFLVHVTLPDGKSAASSAATKQVPKDDSAKTQNPPPPKEFQQTISMGVNVPSPAGLEGMLTFYSGALAGVVTLVTLAGLALRKLLRHTIGVSDLDFDKSLVANVSFTGLLLTAVGLSTVLPDTTQLMGKQSYAALGLFAAVLTLLAPAIFHLGQRRVQIENEDRLVGRVWITAIASGLLLWGATLQLGSFWLQLIEVSESRTITLESLALFSYVLLLIAIGLCVYVPVSVITTAGHQSVEVQPTAGTPAASKIGLIRAEPPKIASAPGDWRMP